MKVANAEKHVLGHEGLQEQKGFEIRASAHAFKILSSGLYSDKVAAVLREIGCNAYDAHVEAGCAQKPFEVKLPTALDNQFYIRDHGPGLSHQGIMNLYTTYFASTKQESNDYTGAFGLGSKSPFSYTDAFTVTSVYNGKKRIYTAHIGDSGSPVVALMGESEADDGWEHGLEIGFPVKPADFREFSDKAHHIYRGFKTIPKILGGAQVKPMQFKQDFGDYAILKEDSGLWATMGNVLYPIDTTKLNGTYKDKKSTKYLEAANGRLDGVLLRFQIGDLQVAASREELQYDPATQRAIEGRLIKMIGDVIEEVKNRIDNVHTWGDMCKAYEVRNDVQNGIRLTSELLQAAGFSKKLIDVYNSYYFELPKTLPTAGAHLAIVWRDPHEHNKLKVNRPSSATGRQYVEYGDNITIVAGDDDRAWARIRKAFADDTIDGRVILVAARDGGTIQDVDALREALEKLFVGVPVRRLSEFDPPALAPKVRRKKGQKPALPEVFVDVDGSTVTITSVPDDRKVYIPAYSRSSWGRGRHLYILRDGHELEQYQWNQIWAHVEAIKREMPHFSLPAPVVIRRYDAKRCKFETRPEWKPFECQVKEVLLDKENLTKLGELIEDHKPIVDIRNDYSMGTGVVPALVGMMEYKPTLFKIVEKVLEKHNILGEIEAIHKRSKKAKTKFYDASVTPQVLTSYNYIASTLDIDVKTPEFKGATRSLDAKFKNTDVDYGDMLNIGKVSSRALATLIEDLII